jgi:very-short-patch-repair endonuclease
MRGRRVWGNACPAMNGDDPARSQAERYLFERLQAHPETADLFELNGILAVDGDWNGSLEVDLLAHSVRVALEIDGFFHFQDLEAYRRDRRRDVLLQRAGYLIIRCLADDVVSRLEEIMHTIISAVRQRRERSMQPQEQPFRCRLPQ